MKDLRVSAKLKKIAKYFPESFWGMNVFFGKSFGDEIFEEGRLRQQVLPKKFSSNLNLQERILSQDKV
jgi:hypothetical protein